MRVSAPPFIEPCYYGTDIDSREGLIANKFTVDEIAKVIGADSLGYLSVDNVTKLCGCGDTRGYCTACFDGKYPTDVPEHSNKDRFEKKLSETKPEKSIK